MYEKIQKMHKKVFKSKKYKKVLTPIFIESQI